VISTIVMLALGAGDALQPVQVGSLTLKAPTAWKRSAVEAGESFSEGDATLELAVYPVDPKRDGQQCVEQLVKAVGGEWTPLKLGGAPAVRKLTTDYVGDGAAAKTEANKVTTVQYMGCNGATKWVLTATSTAAKAARFGPVFKKVAESVTYGK
jgi:hypothetical protein